MIDDKDAEIKELQLAVTQDLQIIVELWIGLETMRALLFQHGVLSGAEHEQLHAVRLQQWNDFVQARLPATVETRKNALLRRLLEEFKGRPQ